MPENNIILFTIFFNFITANLFIYLTIKIANKYFFLDFYLKNESNKLKKIKSIKIYNYLNNNEYLIDLSFDELKLDEKKIFIKITDPNSNIYLQEDVKIKLINRYNLENYKIIDNFKNCYYLKN